MIVAVSVIPLLIDQMLKVDRKRILTYKIICCVVFVMSMIISLSNFIARVPSANGSRRGDSGLYVLRDDLLCSVMFGLLSIVFMISAYYTHQKRICVMQSNSVSTKMVLTKQAVIPTPSGEPVKPMSEPADTKQVRNRQPMSTVPPSVQLQSVPTVAVTPVNAQDNQVVKEETVYVEPYMVRTWEQVRERGLHDGIIYEDMSEQDACSRIIRYAPTAKLKTMPEGLTDLQKAAFVLFSD